MPMIENYPSRSLDRIIIRLPDGMRSQLKDLARRNRRSVNAEVVTILEGKLSETETASAA